MADALESQARALLTAKAVRARAGQMLELGLAGGLTHFTVDLDRIDGVADAVLAVTRKAYPTLDIPFHARWRHFVLGGIDRWSSLEEVEVASWPDRAARARAEFDLAIVSVLLDAGAGATWRYRDAKTRMDFGRSEGLALASLNMFVEGAFSGDPRSPFRVDADVIAQLSIDRLRSGFRVTDNNPLLGLEGRTDLLRRLGKQVAARPEIFGLHDTPRPGGLFDHIAAQASGGAIAAPAILSAVLNRLGPIWPSRLELGGIPLGDCWRHPAIKADDGTAGLVPLHKLSQWLSYSLIEPLQRAGFEVTDIDGLTGLAEYRNGGLFVDHDVLRLRDAADAARAHEVDSLLVVEWRALTIALLDRLAERIRSKLGRTPRTLPLASILEGGTWAAGRAIAFARRPDGSPPLKVISDGTVF
ncbi:MULTISPECIES: URC4/urg3 family protein [Bradyrhizobium]|uniref:URC4/urg3 family protein n=1 Tax=Bradyrhizobium TaxID=374 RepID=UPI0004B085B4|nr:MULTISPECIES: URC4/urg3 family protein [Bradyrhizobium]MCA1500403.1 URC4/urg3 family protein [Bradyrhizobium sp. NBAIM14]MCA1535155.1 URC4/urg3 family protein [Bradyrhizobium sp. NBAIM03]